MVNNLKTVRTVDVTTPHQDKRACDTSDIVGPDIQN